MSGKWHGGKGSRPRPYSVDQQTFESNWELAFGKNKKTVPNDSNEINLNKDRDLENKDENASTSQG
jgi:hypothetical protein